MVFAFEIDELGDFSLHAVGELVGGHAGGKIRAVGAGCEVTFVELREEVEVCALALGAHADGAVEI